MRNLRTIKDYQDEIERLINEQYLLMLNKFPIGSKVEFYRKSIIESGIVMYHAKNKCSLRIQPLGRKGAWLSWVSAIICEPENPIEIRTINCGYEKGKKGDKKNVRATNS